MKDLIAATIRENISYMPRWKASDIAIIIYSEIHPETVLTREVHHLIRDALAAMQREALKLADELETQTPNAERLAQWAIKYGIESAVFLDRYDFADTEERAEHDLADLIPNADQVLATAYTRLFSQANLEVAYHGTPAQRLSAASRYVRQHLRAASAPELGDDPSGEEYSDWLCGPGQSLVRHAAACAGTDRGAVLLDVLAGLWNADAMEAA
jgi:hypothetical protein